MQLVVLLLVVLRVLFLGQYFCVVSLIVDDVRGCAYLSSRIRLLPATNLFLVLRAYFVRIFCGLQLNMVGCSEYLTSYNGRYVDTG